MMKTYQSENITSPYLLSIGEPLLSRKRMRLRSGSLTDLRAGKGIAFDRMITSLDRVNFVLVGEQHDNANHHRFQADVIRGLARRGRPVIVGMEMFHRTNQYPLDLWTLGRLNEQEFIEQSQWKTQWGFDYTIYKPIFDVVKEFRLRLTGLNIPREIVRKVGRQGWGALTPEEKMGVPELDLNRREHRTLFNSLMGGHPPGPGGENIYAAQVLWDTGMADSALKYWERAMPSSNTAFVIVAGNGHVMYGQGISLRLTMRTDLPCATIVCLNAENQGETIEVSRSLADFAYVESVQ
jgi:uncharacterized iron-regulated protein